MSIDKVLKDNSQEQKSEKIKKNLIDKEDYRSFKQMVNTFYSETVEDIENISDINKKKGTIKIEPQIYYDKFAGDMKVEFKIGNKKCIK